MIGQDDLQFTYDHFLRYLPTPEWRRAEGVCEVTGRHGHILLKKGSNGLPAIWVHKHIAPLYPRYETPPKPGTPVKDHPNAGNTPMFKFGGAAVITIENVFVTFDLMAWRGTPIQHVPLKARELLMACYYDSFPKLTRPESLKLPHRVTRPFIFMPIFNVERIAANLRCTYDSNIIDVCDAMTDLGGTIIGAVRIDLVEQLRSRGVAADELATALRLITSPSEKDRKRLLDFSDKADINELWDAGLFRMITESEITLLKWLQRAEADYAKQSRKRGVDHALR